MMGAMFCRAVPSSFAVLKGLLVEFAVSGSDLHPASASLLGAMMHPVLAAINAGLSQIPVNAIYDIIVIVAGQPYLCSAPAETHRLRVEAFADSDSHRGHSARTSLIVDSVETLQKLSRSGQAGVFQLIASGRLRIDGDTGHLQALREELAPHKAALDAIGANVARAAAAPSEGVSETLVRWVPDDAAATCMDLRCGRRFGPFFRRHHCRACGGVFCKHCAPGNSIYSPHTHRRERVCATCREGAYRSFANGSSFLSQSILSNETSNSMLPKPLHDDAGREVEEDKLSPTAEVEEQMDAAEIMLNFSVEQQLLTLRTVSRMLLMVLLTIGVVISWVSCDVWLQLLTMVVHSPMVVQVVLACGLCMALWLRSLVWRLLRVTWVASVLIGSLLWSTRLARFASGKGKTAIWEMSHRVHARFLTEAVADLSGFYVKIAQSLSVQTAIPEPFHVELSKLQDAMPADPHEEVERTLAEELGPNWRSKVSLHPGPPLGSATIAQVHRATLRVPGLDGTEKEIQGVIKVQHRKMKGNLTADIHAAGLLGAVFAFVSPDLFDDIGDIIRDTAELTKAELDFRIEAENQRMARDAAISAGVNVVIPVVYNTLVTRRILAMEFIDGSRLNDFAKVASHEEKTRAVKDLISFFAFSFTQAGIFNCDPHPGNLLVTADSRLVVLDWGQARRLTDREMEAYCLLFVAASLDNPYMLVKVGESIGIKYEEHVAVSMVPALRFLMRDSRPLAMSKEDMRGIEKMFARFSDFKELGNVKGDAKDILRGPLMPLSKTVDLLHNVSTRLSVNLSLLQVFTAKGFAYLLQHSATPGIPLPSIRVAEIGFVLEPAAPARVLQAQPRGPLEARLKELLLAAHHRGDLLGAQVIVLSTTDGQVLTDLSVGHCSYLRGREVTSSTQFNVGEISKLLLAFAVMRLVEKGTLHLNSKLGDFWPAAQGLRDVTLEQVLSHTAGVWQLFPKGVKDMASMGDLPGMLRVIETTGLAPLVQPGTVQKYHHYTFGWMLAGLLRGSGQHMVPQFDADLVMNRDSILAMSVQDIAETTKPLNSSSVSEVAEMFQDVNQFLDIVRKGRLIGASEAEKANAESLMGVHGYSHWLNPASFEQHGFAKGILPGVIGYGSATTLANFLLRAERGQLVRRETLQNMKRSRRTEQIDAHLPLDLRRFSGSEWGLGTELVTLPGRDKSDKAWGHTSSNGSFAVVVPGRRPMVAVLLVNRSDSWKCGVPDAILREIAACTGSAVQAQHL